MNPPQAILFDMDGTILDWQSGMEESWLASCEAHCDGSFAPAALHEAIRARRTWFWDDAERARNGRLDLDAASRAIVRLAFDDAGLRPVDLADRIADDYRARRTAAIAPYPGAIETLAALRERGARLALLTNGGAESQRRSIERFGLAQYFACIVIEGEFGCGKPDERVFRHALAAVGCEPAAAWMVGDNLEADIAPAVALGLHAVWVDGGAGARPAAPGDVRPHRIVRSISELV
ncbi:MAG: HAD family hydrolase [Chloroflexota bacterium]|nr:HAD family hydrolase [Chloroflexota bacterium]